MARPRAFETKVALERAMGVFWQFGYEEASLPDLLTGMGLTRGSLYKAFKDKKNLFLIVLELYESVAVDAAVETLNDKDTPDGRDRIIQMFEGLIAAAMNGDHRGCLLCTAAAGSASSDPDIAQTVHQGMTKMQGGLLAAIDAAPMFADLSNPERNRLANTLLTQYIGLQMLARSRLSLGILQHAADAIEDILTGAAHRP
ncbi:MAG: TetR/AcrR family transcriptional regulator [Sulfitobacter sp.]